MALTEHYLYFAVICGIGSHLEKIMLAYKD